MYFFPHGKRLSKVRRRDAQTLNHGRPPFRPDARERVHRKRSCARPAIGTGDSLNLKVPVYSRHVSCILFLQACQNSSHVKRRCSSVRADVIFSSHTFVKKGGSESVYGVTQHSNASPKWNCHSAHSAFSVHATRSVLYIEPLESRLMFIVRNNQKPMPMEPANRKVWSSIKQKALIRQDSTGPHVPHFRNLA